MKTMGNVTIAFILILISISCATTPTLTGKEVPGVVAESPPVLVLGSKFVFQTTNLVSGKLTGTYTWVVAKKEPYEKKDAYWVDTTGGRKENYSVYDMNLNWMASIRKDVEQTCATPCLKEFDWPLKVGKRWQTSYDYFDRSRGSSFRGASEPVTVESYEEVKVPAGNFQAFKIVREGRTFKVTKWYAPSVGMVIKQQLERTADNTLGYGQFVHELTEYSIPTK